MRHKKHLFNIPTCTHNQQHAEATTVKEAYFCDKFKGYLLQGLTHLNMLADATQRHLHVKRFVVVPGKLLAPVYLSSQSARACVHVCVHASVPRYLRASERAVCSCARQASGVRVCVCLCMCVYICVRVESECV